VKECDVSNRPVYRSREQPTPAERVAAGMSATISPMPRRSTAGGGGGGGGGSHGSAGAGGRRGGGGGVGGSSPAGTLAAHPTARAGGLDLLATYGGAVLGLKRPRSPAAEGATDGGAGGQAAPFDCERSVSDLRALLPAGQHANPADILALAAAASVGHGGGGGGDVMAATTPLVARPRARGAAGAPLLWAAGVAAASEPYCATPRDNWQPQQLQPQTQLTQEDGGARVHASPVAPSVAATARAFDLVVVSCAPGAVWEAPRRRAWIGLQQRR
jgi:hypothetical protein